jgi:predicted enzyme related to lactoylglutathione lyase
MNMNSILIGSENPDALTAYYTKVLGKPTWDDSGFIGWQLGTGGIMIGHHDQVKGKNAAPGRIIWNIETPDVKQRFDEFKAAGATVVQEPYQPGGGDDMWVATFADPDDNYFQLVSVME